MSAHLYDPEAIARLAVTAAVMLPGGLDPWEVAEQLARENLASIAHRYPDAAEPRDWCEAWGGREEYVGLCLDAIRGAKPLRPSEVEEEAESLAYQSCEHPEWGASYAKSCLDSLREAASSAVAVAAPPVRTPQPRPRYLTCAETAKLLRQALKAAFPGVRFGVRSHTYAGGASIDVEWLDGPTEAEVSAITNRHRAADFDSMIDMETSRAHWLTPQGEVYVAEVRGTEGQRGSIAGAEYIKPHDDAELVSLGSKYIHTRRNYSRAMLERACAWALREWGEAPEIRAHEWKGEVTGYYLHADRSAYPDHYGAQCYTIADVARREMAQQTGPRHKDRTK